MKKGQSQIIVTILLILMVIAAVIILYNVVYVFLGNASDNAEINSFIQKTDITRVELEGDSVKVTIRPRFDTSSIDGFKFSFFMEDGEIVVADRTDVPGRLGTKEYIFGNDEIVKKEKIVKISVVSFNGNRVGSELSSYDVSDNRVYLIDNAGGESGDSSGWSGFNDYISDNAHSGNYAFYSKDNDRIFSSSSFGVDLTKDYLLSGWFKSVGSSQSKIYFGFQVFDAQGREIKSNNILVVENSETELYEDVHVGDSLIKVNDASGWVEGQYRYVAFDVDDSGSYSDLPNFNLERINSVVDKGSYWEVNINGGVDWDYVAGTKVREHLAGNTYMYSCAVNNLVPNEWTKYECRVGGECLAGYCGDEKWRAGTSSAKVYMSLNHNQNSDNEYSYEMLVDDLSVKEL